ncbi:MAG: extracellular solute-binding protein [Methylobacteriaceae bacterium]|nr:extracellular solute-binding protein [Methylobacteriaceae bacterium]
MLPKSMILAAALGAAIGGAAPCLAQSQPYAGVQLHVASQNDQFAGPLVQLAPEFEKATGIKVSVDILSYPELLTKITADFIGKTKGYDVVTMDIVWAGQFKEAGYTLDLGPWIERDKAELDLDDIYPVALKSLGQYGGTYVAYPFAGYANVLAYRKDLYEAKSLIPPKTIQELVKDAYALTDRAKNVYGFVANGQKGPAVAQDWMQYNSQLGGSILDASGKPALNSRANVESLKVYKELFVKAAPPGAVNYDWGGREESFRQGLVANMQTWSVGSAGYYDPKQSKVVDKVAIVPAPPGEGVKQKYGFGGWGLAINAGIDKRQQEAAWVYIKWVTSPAVQKEMSKLGAGGYIRKSTVADPELNKLYPFLPVLDTEFKDGDGDYRPRIPQYPQIQDILGTAVNAVLVGDADPKAALDKAQAAAEKLF